MTSFRDYDFKSSRRPDECDRLALLKEFGVNFNDLQTFTEVVPDNAMAEAVASTGVDIPIGRILLDACASCGFCNSNDPNNRCDVASVVEEIAPFLHELPVDISEEWVAS